MIMLYNFRNRVDKNSFDKKQIVCPTLVSIARILEIIVRITSSFNVFLHIKKSSIVFEDYFVTISKDRAFVDLKNLEEIEQSGKKQHMAHSK